MSKIEVKITASRPIFIEADADSFGNIFAHMADDEQVHVFRAMVEHMRSHQTQWDYIAIALEKDENRDVRETLQSVLFPVEAVNSHEALVAENKRIREQAEWQPIATCPLQEPVDLWCVYGGEEFAQYDGGASIGKIVSNRFKTEEYGFFGNQSNDGIPQRDAPDLVPVAWRDGVPMCPAKLIAEAIGIPVSRDEAIAALSTPSPEA